MPGVKPAGAMKTLSGTFAFVVLAVIGLVTLISCPAKFAFTEQKFTLHFKEAEVRDEDAFKNALKTLKKHGGQCYIKFVRKDGETIKDYCDKLDVDLKTDKVTKSEVANSAAAGESAANDPYATYKVTSADPTDIKTVLDAFASPTPAP
jgi:hypothetical protein